MKTDQAADRTVARVPPQDGRCLVTAAGEYRLFSKVIRLSPEKRLNTDFLLETKPCFYSSNAKRSIDYHLTDQIDLTPSFLVFFFLNLRKYERNILISLQTGLQFVIGFIRNCVYSSDHVLLLLLLLTDRPLAEDHEPRWGHAALRLW